MDKLSKRLIHRCRTSRRRGFSFGGIASLAGVPKSTLHFYSRDIDLPAWQKRNLEERRKLKCRRRGNPRKGRCLVGREVRKLLGWSDKLAHAVAHYTFDGRIDEHGCIYYSKDKQQVAHLKRLLFEIFKARPGIQFRDNGVYGLVFLPRRARKISTESQGGASGVFE